MPLNHKMSRQTKKKDCTSSIRRKAEFHSVSRFRIRLFYKYRRPAFKMFASLEIMNFDKEFRIPAADSDKFADLNPVPPFFGQAADLQHLKAAKTLDGNHITVFQAK